MENNEIMNNIEEVTDVGEEIIEATKSYGAGTVTLIVLGLTAAGFAAFKFGKKAYNLYKNKKEFVNGNMNVEIDPVDVSDGDAE
jgi:hypothetical protein